MIRIEEMSMNALPALSTVFYKGWVLRFSEGYARRGNSVSIIGPYRGDLQENIDYCEDLYSTQKLPTIFKVTSHEVYKAIDEALSDRGYTVVAQTKLMTMDLSAYASDDDPEGLKVDISDRLTEEWFKGYMAIISLNEPHQRILKKMLESIIPSTVYASIKIDNQIVAVGLGVSESDHMGIYHIYVHETHRRQGLGKRMMGALIKEAINLGNTQTYLQVMTENEKAIKLYSQMGYVPVYDYWYRVKE